MQLEAGWQQTEQCRTLRAQYIAPLLLGALPERFGALPILLGALPILLGVLPILLGVLPQPLKSSP